MRLSATHKGAFTVTLHVPGPGAVSALITAWDSDLAHGKPTAHERGAHGQLEPAAGRFVFARGHQTATRAGTITLFVKPTAAGLRLLARHRYRVTLRLWLTYAPAVGEGQSLGFYGLHP